VGADEGVDVGADEGADVGADKGVDEGVDEGVDVVCGVIRKSMGLSITTTKLDLLDGSAEGIRSIR
jgi:hypothetical protein